MVQSTPLYRLQFVRMKPVSTIQLQYNTTYGTSIEKAISRREKNGMDAIIMGKDLHVSMPEASIYSYLKWWRPSEKN